MDPNLVIVLTILAAAVITPILWLMNQFTFRNREVQMRALANQLGLEYLSSIPSSQVGSIATSKLLRMADDGRVVHFMFGQTDQARIQLFDYEYIEKNHNYQMTKRQTVVAMMFTGMQLAPCRIYPESCLNFVSEWLGDQDINFEEHAEFSRMFVVQSHHEDEVRLMFDRELMDFFCQDPDLNFESTRTAFLLYEPKRLLNPDQIKAKMKDAYAVYQELLAQQERRPANPGIQVLSMAQLNAFQAGSTV